MAVDCKGSVESLFFSNRLKIESVKLGHFRAYYVWDGDVDYLTRRRILALVA